MGKVMNDMPQIFVEGSYSQPEVDDFLKKTSGCEVHNIYEEQLKELFEVLHPSSPLNGKDEKYHKFMQSKNAPGKGSWVFFPWSKRFIHMLNEEDFFLVRTNRNRNLISQEEQSKMQIYSIGIAGLSVGGSIAVALAHSAVGGELVLMDRDSFATSNMNRVRVSVGDISRPKLGVTMRQIYEANPYAKLRGLENGITKQNVEELFNRGNFIVFDEIDDFEMKVRLRQAAKRNKAPVVMLTNLGDNVLIDIERYDKQPKTKIFNGLIDDVIDDILSGQIGEEEKKKFAAQIVGIEHIPTRALQSLKGIGTSLVGRPQFYSSVSLSAGLATYIVRRIILDEPLDSGRYFLSLADIFKVPRDDLEMTDERKAIIGQLRG